MRGAGRARVTEVAIRLFPRPEGPLPHDEPARQKDVDALPPPGYRTADLDRIAGAAAELIGAPVGLVTLVDRDRLAAPGCHGYAFGTLARAESICAHGVMDPDSLLCVPDLLEDARFADLKLAHGPDAIRFYAGAPLVSRSGRALGMLCVVDGAPRPMPDAEQREALRRLARVAAARLEGTAA